MGVQFLEKMLEVLLKKFYKVTNENGVLKWISAFFLQAVFFADNIKTQYIMITYCNFDLFIFIWNKELFLLA